MSSMKLPAGLKDWRTTVIGMAQAVNAIIPAVQAIQAANAGVVFIDPITLARFFLIAAVLNAIKGVITPSSAKVKEKTDERIEQKFESLTRKD